MTPIEIAHAFGDAIVRRDPEEIATWMTDDHVLLDSLGNRLSGRQRMTAAWRAQVKGNLIAEWRVYADYEPIRRLMARGK